MKSRSKKESLRSKKKSTVVDAEVAQFNDRADEWWDESGALKPLHLINPLRLEYIKQRVYDHSKSKAPPSSAPLRGLKVADIGCGGGLVAEPLCRMGAEVTGVDAGAANIRAAKQHAQAQGLAIDYRVTTAEALARKAPGAFDIVTALEIVEHVADPALFLRACGRLLKPGGLLILSTLNRTPKSFLFGILAAEYVLRWVPAGTHDWNKFLKPSELAEHAAAAGVAPTDICGMAYDPFARRFVLKAEDTTVNYLLTGIKS